MIKISCYCRFTGVGARRPFPEEGGKNLMSVGRAGGRCSRTQQMIDLQIAKRMPLPCGSVVKKGSNIWSASPRDLRQE